MRILKNSQKKILSLDLIFAAVLLLYPMRHIYWGLDFWDTGYNYANFVYMDHMDPMWLFSTYLSNVVGHFLTLLPGAGGLLGMNFYTGLFASGLAAGGYFFCTKKLEMPRGIAFAGEMAALSLCWCPTALLYNYITYVFFLACVVLLYIGLTEEKQGCLFAAGVCLGANVFVRFSNLPEAAMIVAVWAWDFIVWLEGRVVGGKAGGGGQKCRWAALRHTLWCLGGYLAAVAALFGFIGIRYGFQNYIAGIRRLFAMTDNAADYKASSMLLGMIRIYVDNMYWVVRFGVIVLAGVAGFALAEAMVRWTGRRAERIVRCAVRVLWCGGMAGMLVWLYKRGVYSFSYFSYDAILRPAILFLMLVMLVGIVRIFYPNSPREEKLISGMVILVVLLTSIGSNNGVYPSFNNLFVVAPYALWECWRFARCAGVWKWQGGIRRMGRAAAMVGGNNREDSDGLGLVVSAFPAKTVIAVLLALFFFQSVAFGACFVFEEATGAKNITGVVENNKTLKGIRMNPERARWMTEISAYVEEHGLQGREVILFGQLPSLSYYLQMPSAFNPWSDLRSYSYEVMESAIGELSAGLEEKGRERPVLILDKGYARQYEWYLEGGSEKLREMGVEENQIRWIEGTQQKYLLLRAFAEKFNYDLTFENEKFVLYE